MDQTSGKRGVKPTGRERRFLSGQLQASSFYPKLRPLSARARAYRYFLNYRYGLNYRYLASFPLLSSASASERPWLAIESFQLLLMHQLMRLKSFTYAKEICFRQLSICYEHRIVHVINDAQLANNQAPLCVARQHQGFFHY